MSDEVQFASEKVEINKNDSAALSNWKILIVDDEKEIHLVTTHVLKNFNFNERGIDFFHAYSAEESKAILKDNSDIALIFLDVVMETDDAGLRLIEWIRGYLGNRFVRIVLRTGQPGLAPEKNVILNYDIDDYRAKTELTAVRLFTTTVASLRAYRIMMDQEENRIALEALVKTSWSMNSIRNVKMFLDGVMPQVSSFMSLGENSFFSEVKKVNGVNILKPLMGSGRFKLIDDDFASELTEHEHEIVDIALAEGHHVFEDQIVVGVVLHTDPANSRLLFIESHEKIKSLDLSVLKIFLSSLDSAFENMLLAFEVEEAHVSQINMQKALLDRLNNVISIRSKETAGHVRRVAECSVLLAEYHGQESEYLELLKTASPMHDIGKIGVPDSILLKPGQLTESERDIINTHASIGRDMFEGDESPLLQMTRDIAGGHHEKWDGSGYPSQLKGVEIPLAGRITAICDVFDALSSARPYKDALPLDIVTEIMNNGRGQHFDPELLDLFMDHLDEMCGIFNTYD
ncbi:MAG: DUF3369 domain-containing protein [Spirochaetaceae bacterium]